MIFSLPLHAPIRLARRDLGKKYNMKERKVVVEMEGVSETLQAWNAAKIWNVAPIPYSSLSPQASPLLGCTQRPCKARSTQAVWQRCLPRTAAVAGTLRSRSLPRRVNISRGAGPLPWATTPFFADFSALPKHMQAERKSGLAKNATPPHGKVDASACHGNDAAVALLPQQQTRSQKGPFYRTSHRWAKHGLCLGGTAGRTQTNSLRPAS